MSKHETEAEYLRAKKSILQLMRDSERERERFCREAQWRGLWQELKTKDGWLLIGWFALSFFLSCAFFPIGIFSFVFMAPFVEHYTMKWRRQER